MNREKNYNKLFNAKPYVGVLDPLQAHVSKLILMLSPRHYIACSSMKQKKKRVSEVGGVRYSSAPSLVSPLPTEFTSTTSSGFSYPTDAPPPPPHGPPPQPHHLAPLTTANGGSSSSSLGSSVSQQGTHILTKKGQAQHSALESKPKRLMMLQDSPLTQQKLGKTAAIRGGRTVGNHSTPLQPIERSISPKNTTLLVQ
jgi:hypothetical protein